MDSDTFDDLVRGAFASSSRRGALRVGVGGLAASMLTAIGLSTDSAEAKKKKKKKKKKKPVVATCPPDLPLVCGDGCCPSAYPLCCLASFGFGGGGAVVAVSTPDESTCNPASFTCCPADQGGDACGGRFPKCCPATAQAPFGTCTLSDAVCCTTEQGGFSCPADEPVCCLNEPGNIFGGRNCCPTGSTCCQADADCPGGGAGSCVDGCCAVGPREAGRNSGRGRQVGVERLHMPAR